LRILALNLHCRAGAIDLVAQDGGTLVFIEVRHRGSLRFGGAAASVNRAKQARLARAAGYFLPHLVRRCFAGRPPACRFDVVALEGAELRWIRDAFQWNAP
jgi:putative endonuclease